MNSPPGNHPASQGRRRRWLTRNIVAIALLSLFSDMSHEMVTAILPFFVISIGGTALALGLIEGVSDLIASVAKIGGSYYSDRIGRRKPILIAGYALTAAKGVMAFATTVPAVLVIRTFAWFGRGMRSPVRDALLAESVVPEYTGRAFGLHRAADTAGAILGPAIALGLLLLAVSYRDIFLVSLIPGAATLLIVLFVVRDRAGLTGHGKTLMQSLQALPGGFRRFVASVGVFGLGNFGPTLLILRAQELLTPAWGTARADAWALGLYVWLNVVYAAGAYPAGVWSERLGKRRILGLGYFLFALMCLGFLVVGRGIPGLVVLFAVGGLYVAFVDAMEGALAADLLPPEVYGTGYGVLGAVNGLGDLLSSVIVGFLWVRVSVASGFIYALVLAGLGAMLLLTLVRDDRVGE